MCCCMAFLSKGDINDQKKKKIVTDTHIKAHASVFINPFMSQLSFDENDQTSKFLFHILLYPRKHLESDQRKIAFFTDA